MPGFALFGGSKGSGTDRGYGDLTDRELDLLDEAELAEAGAPLDDNVFYHAFPDEGAVYIHENQGSDYNTTFSYGDGDQADDALLTSLNSTWNG
jgi:hypothetical protein